MLRRAKSDVRASSISTPAGFARTAAKMRVRVGDALIDFVFIGVYLRTRRRVTDGPKALDKTVAGLVGSEPQESAAFFLGNDVGDVAIQPLLVILGKLVLAVLFVSSSRNA